MASYREIVTKSVIGKGKKTFTNNYTFSVTEVPTTILGCWVINHTFKGFKAGREILSKSILLDNSKYLLK